MCATAGSKDPCQLRSLFICAEAYADGLPLARDPCLAGSLLSYTHVISKPLESTHYSRRRQGLSEVSLDYIEAKAAI